MGEEVSHAFTGLPDIAAELWALRSYIQTLGITRRCHLFGS
jgi:hypothetical protein